MLYREFGDEEIYNQKRFFSSLLFLCLRSVVVFLVAEVGIDGLRLRLAPGSCEHRVFLGLVGVLEQGRSRILFPHRAQRDALADMLLVGLIP